MCNTRFEQRIVINEAANIRRVVVGLRQRINCASRFGKAAGRHVFAETIEKVQGPWVTGRIGHLNRPITQRINHPGNEHEISEAVK